MDVQHLGQLAFWLPLAIVVGVAHTLMSPDHYLPFIALSRARRWSFAKTMTLTALCGLGHVVSALFLAAIGLWLGEPLSRLGGSESMRGQMAASLLMAFGFAYFVWSLHDLLRSKAQVAAENKNGVTFWLLFIVFILGPCEPLIPLVMAPGVAADGMTMALTTCVFGLSTVVTMLVTVAAAVYSLSHLRTSFLEKYSHCLAGATLLICGACVEFLGL